MTKKSYIDNPYKTIFTSQKWVLFLQGEIMHYMRRSFYWKGRIKYIHNDSNISWFGEKNLKNHLKCHEPIVLLWRVFGRKYKLLWKYKKTRRSYLKYAEYVFRNVVKKYKMFKILTTSVNYLPITRVFHKNANIANFIFGVPLERNLTNEVCNFEVIL